ncbi:type II CAAX endopeptidase family protein [Hathewaya histolytica]|uniref:CAAX amino terminal protease family protein n=1 Tax=Hathewaya histolytica TaxID=1498 RepID=A0A4U9QU92_HATHI|nr:type II CAAX endopeptidase family protein [Hathewaya histolytica]VTQ82206.1 CAAX amino terminal protease family protein [Hathewaya histolytica]
MEKVVVNDKYGLSIRKSLFVFFIYFILNTILMVLVQSILMSLEYTGADIDNFKKYVYLLVETINYVVFIKIYKNLTENKLRFSNTVKVSKYMFIFFIIIGYIFIYDNTLNVLVQKFTTNSWYNEALKKEFESPISLVLGAAIVAPIFEEILLRGIILEGLIVRNKPYVAITISSLLFALMHGNLVQIPNAFFIGFVIGIIYYRTRSLLPCIFAHFVNNFFTIITVYNPDLYNDAKFSFVKLGIGTIIFISSFYMFKRSTKHS